jgi:hypothetical protein
MGVRQLRIFIHQPARYHQMCGDDFGKFLGQAPQLRTN